MTPILWLLLLGSQHYTFDPYSLSKVEYLPQNCHHAEDGWARCKKVRVTFEKIVPVREGQTWKDVVGIPYSGKFTSSQGSGRVPKVTYHFRPRLCREIRGDRLGRYECKDFWWRESK